MLCRKDPKPTQARILTVASCDISAQLDNRPRVAKI